MSLELSPEIGRRLDRIDAQLAGLVGVAAASIEACPPPGQHLLRALVVAQLEHLMAVVLADTGAHSDSALDAVQALRTLLVGAPATNDESWRRRA